MSTAGDAFLLSERLRERGLTLSLAESCTGGQVSELMTSSPGASDYFLGCAVTYSNESKERILGVSRETLMRHGAVSEETAKEMASGARRVFGSSIAAAVTGIAGPGGGTDEKPVGLVFIAATDGESFVVSENRFWGDRQSIRRSSVMAVLRSLMTLTGMSNDI